MKKQRDTSLQIRVATIAILVLLIVLAAVAYISGRQVQSDGDLIAQDAVPGTINAHYMRMAMSRSIGWVLVAGSAQTPQSRDASLKIVHDADVAFTDAFKQYEATIKLNPVADSALLEQLKNYQADFCKKRMAYEALILSGNREESAAFLNDELIPVFLQAIKSAEELLKYNHTNSITFATSIRRSVNQLYWAVAVVVLLAVVCAVVLVCNLTIRRRELAELLEKEEKFSKAFQSNPSGISISEVVTGRYIEVNDSFCRILGYPPEEVIGYTTLDKGIWNSAERREGILQPLLNGGSLRNHEIQVRTRYGVGKILSLNAELIELGGRKCVMSLIEDITERKRSEEALKTSEDLFRTSFESATDGVCLVAADGRFFNVNRTLCDMLGYSREELLQMTFNQVTHEEDREIGRAFLDNALAGGPKSMQTEKRYIRKDGQVVWALLSTAVIQTAREHGACLISHIQDITKRKMAEESLRLSEKMFSLIFRENPIPLAVSEFDTGRFIEINNACLKLMHAEPAQMLARTSIEIGMVTSDERKKIVEEVRSHGGADRLEISMTRLDDQPFVSELTCSAYELSGKRYLLTSIVDITERKRLEQKQAELAAIVESSEDAIIGKTLDGVVTSWNRGAEKIFGYTAAEAIGQKLLFLFPPERQDDEAEILAKISKGETVQHFEAVRIRKDGRRIFISATISPLRDNTGKVIGASKIARDITAQKQADEALRESRERIRILGDNLPSGMMYQLDMGPDGQERRFTYISAGVEKLHEVTVESVMQDAQVLYGQIAEADRPLVAAREAEALASMKPFVAELRMQLPSGAARWSLVASAPRHAASGHVLWDGIELDITEQKQAELRIHHLNRVYEVLSDINKTIVRVKDPQTMLTKACLTAVEKGGFRMAWVGMFDAAVQKIQPVASAGVVDGYLDLVNIDLRDKARSSGPSGRAFLSGEHVTCTDLEHDPLIAPWSEEMLKRGYRSSASFPLKVGGKIQGIFTLYSEQTGFFNNEECCCWMSWPWTSALPWR